MEFKRLNKILDFFLPEYANNELDVVGIYKARSIVLFVLLGLLSSIVVFFVFNFVPIFYFAKIGMFLVMVTFVGLLFYLKSSPDNFLDSLEKGVVVQILLAFMMVHVCSYLEKGFGFFSLLWAFPLLFFAWIYLSTLFCSILYTTNLLGIVIAFFYHKDSLTLVFTEQKNAVLILFLYVLTVFFVISTMLIIHQIYYRVFIRDLLTKKDRLLDEAKFQSLCQIASTLAHDVNNPLFTIQGKLHNMRMMVANDEMNVEKCDVVVDEIETVILRLSRIVKNVSTFAKETQNEQMISIDLEKTLREILLVHSERLLQESINVDLRVEPSLQLICYPSYVARAFANTLLTSLEMMETVEVKNLVIEAFSDDSWIILRIKNTGLSSLNEEDLIGERKSFELKQEKNSERLNSLIVRGLVSAHDGEYSYARENGETIFTLKFPSYE